MDKNSKKDMCKIQSNLNAANQSTCSKYVDKYKVRSFVAHYYKVRCPALQTTPKPQLPPRRPRREFTVEERSALTARFAHSALRARSSDGVDTSHRDVPSSFQSAKRLTLLPTGVLAPKGDTRFGQAV